MSIFYPIHLDSIFLWYRMKLSIGFMYASSIAQGTQGNDIAETVQHLWLDYFSFSFIYSVKIDKNL